MSNSCTALASSEGMAASGSGPRPQRDEMRDDQPLVAAMCRQLETMAGKTAKRLRRARRGDPASVHHARTSLRKLREGLLVLGRARLGSRATTRADAVHRIEQA